MANANAAPTGSPWQARLPFYYGWLVLAAAAVSELLVTGATSYAAPLFVLPLQAEFGLSRANANMAMPILFLGGMVLIPFAGRVLDRRPIRPVLCLGTFVFCLALVAIAFASSAWTLVLALLLPGALGYVLLGPLTTSTLAARWFYRRRGLALGFAAIATSGGGFTVAPLMAMAIQAYGWRKALLGEALLFAILIPALTFIFIRDNPGAVKLNEDPEVLGRQNFATTLPVAESERAQGWWRGFAVLGRRDFWAPSLLFSVIASLSQGVVVSVVPYAAQLRIPAAILAASNALLSVFSVSQATVGAFAAGLPIYGFALTAAATKIAAGIASDRMDKRKILALSTLAMMGALTLLCLVPTFGGLVAASCLCGASLGGVLPTSGALIAERFGPFRFGTVMGITYVIDAVFTIAASRISGVSFDRTGSYHAAFVVFLCSCAVISLAAFALEAKPRHHLN